MKLKILLPAAAIGLTILYFGYFSLHYTPSPIKQKDYSNIKEPYSANTPANAHPAQPASSLGHQNKLVPTAPSIEVNPSLSSTTENTLESIPKLFVIEQDSISISQYGSQVIELTIRADTSRKIHMVTESSVHFFSDDQIDREDITGCNMGDFYIDYSSTISFIYDDGEKLVTKHMRCSHDGEYSYQDTAADDIPSTQQLTVDEVVAFLEN